MQMNVKGNTLVIELDVSDKAVKAAKLSGSGKSKVVATTGGFLAVPGKDGLKIALNLISK